MVCTQYTKVISRYCIAPLPAPQGDRALARRGSGAGRGLSLHRSRARGVRGGAGAVALRGGDDQGDRDHHDEDARWVEGLLAPDHHVGGVRNRDPARLRLHAPGDWRAAGAQPHDEARRAGRGDPERGDRVGDVPARHHRQRAQDHQRPAQLLPAGRRQVPHRPDGEARLGDADAGEPVVRDHHRDPGEHRHRRHPPDRAADP